jgi:hypothetical protein
LYRITGDRMYSMIHGHINRFDALAKDILDEIEGSTERPA